MHKHHDFSGIIESLPEEEESSSEPSSSSLSSSSLLMVLSSQSLPLSLYVHHACHHCFLLCKWLSPPRIPSSKTAHSLSPFFSKGGGASCLFVAFSAITSVDSFHSLFVAGVTLTFFLFLCGGKMSSTLPFLLILVTTFDALTPFPFPTVYNAIIRSLSIGHFAVLIVFFVFSNCLWCSNFLSLSKCWYCCCCC